MNTIGPPGSISLKKTTTDPVLVELAGSASYKDPAKDDYFKVNEIEFYVLDTRYEDPTGLDAMTVQNTETGEISIIYQGTQKDKKHGDKDLLTDAQLTTGMPTIAQLEASKEYYMEMDKKFGVSSVAGNSLGGPLAFSALTVDPDLRCVTINPAPTPKGYLDPDETYSNAINFYSQYDPLTSLTKALGIDRVPGKVVEIESGMAEGSRLGPNHTGFGENEEIEVRGITINGAADEHIVSSIWTGETLTGDSSTRIEIDFENIEQLSSGLEDVKGDFKLAKDCMDKSEEVVLEEGSIFTMRLETMKSTFNDMIEEAITEPSLKGISRAQSLISNEVNNWISKLDSAEQHFLSLNGILNSPPVELVEHIINVDISVESLFQEARDNLNKVFNEVSSLSEGFTRINDVVIPFLLSEAQNKVDDFLVNEMKDHYTIMNSNSVKVNDQLKEFKKSVDHFKTELKNRDITSAISIRNQANAIKDIVKMPTSNDFLLKESDHLLLGMKVKEMILESSFTHLSTVTHVLIGVPIAALAGIVGMIEGAVKGISEAIKKVFRFSHAFTLPASLFPQFQDLEQKITTLARQITRPMDDLGSLLGGVRDSLFRLSIFLPIVVREFKPYLDDAIFTKINYADINSLNLAAKTQLKELKILFTDISFQLSDHKAKSIEALGGRSDMILQNLDKLTEQVKRVTFQ
ncbi:hypothetical protein M1I95_16265 [Rossellomorea marisflavi]|uniref:SA1320 family protein n=1 Tax=Rossellomorea marisflavi TaxID=189381 RepID=UPI0027AA3751|nr:hypothetical protein [Rossellomorea marisflavi]UTE71810.1 hypothetical protein M1I95_16265 [Rossellomorea marisflavi]